MILPNCENFRRYHTELTVTVHLQRKQHTEMMISYFSTRIGEIVVSGYQSLAISASLTAKATSARLAISSPRVNPQGATRDWTSVNC